MIRRHPHVFAQAQAETSEDVLAQLGRPSRRAEKSRAPQTEVMRDVPAHVPGAHARGKGPEEGRDVGFDWDDAREAAKKVSEEADEVEEVLQNPEKPRPASWATCCLRRSTSAA